MMTDYDRMNARLNAKLGVPASPDNDELHLDDSTFSVLDRAIASFLDDETQAPITHYRGEERITIVGLPQRQGKGVCVLVVYGNGQTERYEQLTKTSKGNVVALRSGCIVELYA
jgi:hypothetical protein